MKYGNGISIPIQKGNIYGGRPYIIRTDETDFTTQYVLKKTHSVMCAMPFCATHE